MRAAIVIVTACVSVVVAAPPASASSLTLKRNDYNGDGYSDVLARDLNGNCLYRAYGSASGIIGPRMQVGCGWSSYFPPHAVGDITGDGKADIVAVKNTDNCLYRWAGNGNGTFGAATQVGCGWAPYMRSMAGAGDLNGDGVGDLVAVNTDDSCLYRWFGTGHGSFGPATKVGCGWAAFLTSPTMDISGIGDVNHDGKADIVAGKFTSVGGPVHEELFIWDGNGAGGFGSAIDFSSVNPDIAGYGDINGDGNGDFIYGDSNNFDNIDVWFGTGNNNFTQPPPQGGWTNLAIVN